MSESGRSISFISPTSTRAAAADLRAAALEAEAFINASDMGIALQRISSRLSPMALPHDLARAISSFCLHLAVGDTIAVIPGDGTLSTTQAASILGISRTRLTQLIDAGDIPCSFVGSHRRLQLGDVLAYQSRRTNSTPRPRTTAVQRSRTSTPLDLKSWPRGLDGNLAIPHALLGDPR